MMDQCLTCLSPRISPVLEVASIPVFCNVLQPSREQALAAPRAPLDLLSCDDCGHVFNGAFRPHLVDYRPDYENSLHYSAHFHEFARTVAKRLIERYQVRGKRVIEIGCGRGDFLRLLCEEGPNEGLGLDPGYDGPELLDVGHGIRFLRDYYSSAHADQPVDLLCCRHVLEHLADPGELIRLISRTLGRQPQARIYLEVPNGAYTFEDLGIWDLIYEHCSYFSEESLRRLVSRNGLRPLASGVAFHNQFLWVECAPRSNESLEVS